MIESPSDIKEFSFEELESLGVAIRNRIIEVMSVNGGHLSSNLGVVELTIALHKVFDSPQDKLIFDVSHQSYPHKLLTGRWDRFHQIRKYKGLCGFSHPKESEHDHFFAGHAGTAFSLALGVAKSRDLDGGLNHVIPILGDASLTCGLTLEALNNVPGQLPRFIAILNDNAMSISQNVGNIKNISQPALFFEKFGLTYIGPIDGHDIEKLVHTLTELRELPNPVLLHVITVKGKGMPIAIDNPTPYHGVKPFDLCSGKFLPSPSNKPTFPKIFGKHILKMAEMDPNLVCITPAMPAGSCLDEMMRRYPERCIDVGIAEGHAVTFAGGLAYKAKKNVIVCIYATFLQRALDNLFQDVCMQELPVVFALDRSFISGPDGSTHHGIYDIAFLNTMPNLIIAQPRNGHVLKELLESAFHWKKPAAIRYPNLETEEPDLPIAYRNPGKGEIVAEGKDLLLIGLGHTVLTCLKVRELLLQKGIEATVIDPVFLKPLDAELLNDALGAHRFVATIEEHALNGGLGMIVNNFIVQNGLKHLDVVNIGVPDMWVQFGSNSELMQELGLDAASIAKRLLQEFQFHDHSPLSERKEKALL